MLVIVPKRNQCLVRELSQPQISEIILYVENRNLYFRKIMKTLPDSVKKLIEAKTFANLATLMPDGSPHVAQTWVDHGGGPCCDQYR
jgi:hypothetical protein